MITLSGLTGAVVAVSAVGLTIVVCLGAVFGLLMWLVHLEDTLPTEPAPPRPRRSPTPSPRTPVPRPDPRP